MQHLPKLLAAISMVVAAFTGPSALAATRHVPADYPTIQSCIDAAVSGQDECVVAPGTYNELINFLGKAITLRSSHGPEVTTIDGTGLNGSVVTSKTLDVIPTILDGFTISSGTATYGGGMHNSGYDNGVTRSPLIKNCIFSGNHAAYGGAIYNHSFIRPSISNCVFDDNHALRYGGAVYNWSAYPLISACTFANNSAGYEGGAIRAYSSEVLISHCSFIGNTTFGNGGAIASCGGFNSVIDQCTFENNTALGQEDDCGYQPGGGAIAYNSAYPIMISNCAFGNNKGRRGGAVLGDKLYISSCFFTANEAEETGGALDCLESTVSNSLFRENTASRGGGIHGWVYLFASTFLGNRATESGGALYVDYVGRASSCLFVANQANSGGAISNAHSLSIYNCSLIGNLAGC